MAGTRSLAQWKREPLSHVASDRDALDDLETLPEKEAANCSCLLVNAGQAQGCQYIECSLVNLRDIHFKPGRFGRMSSRHRGAGFLF